MFRSNCEFLNGNVTYRKVNNIKLTTNKTSAKVTKDEPTTQSPIAIVLNECEGLQSPIQLRLTENFSRNPKKIKITNNGMTALVTLPGMVRPPIQNCNTLNSDFQFEQCHFHWSDCDQSGSEHSVDGKKFACEAHFVHFNTKYETFENALDEKDGLLVVGVLLEISTVDNTKLDHLIDAVHRVPYRNSECDYTSNIFFEWLQDVDFNEYITYKGSLTTEPYHETVFWIVANKPITISNKQMKSFRNMDIYMDEKKVKTNSRPIQKPPKDLRVKYTGGKKLKSKL